MKKILYLCMLMLYISCDSNKDDFSYVDLSKAVTLSPSETIFEFDDKYPTSIKVLDSLLYIIQIKSENCMMELDLNTKTINHSFGHVGHGPDDLISPNFIHSTSIPDIIIEDGNLRKILKVEHDNNNPKLIEYMEYPEDIFISSELNFSENFIVGRKVDAFDKKMFYIYNKNSKSMLEVDCYPNLKYKVNDLNYTFAPAIAFNERKNRIIAGMYFFDMFHLYNLKGERIRTFSFSKKCIPNIDKKSNILDLSSGYSGIIRVFPTEKHCYLLRYTQKINNHSEKMLIQIDWEGELINSYKFSDDVSGQFYIDENQKKLYMIRNYINSENSEIFGIVAYKIN